MHFSRQVNCARIAYLASRISQPNRKLRPKIHNLNCWNLKSADSMKMSFSKLKSHCWIVCVCARASVSIRVLCEFYVVAAIAHLLPRYFPTCTKFYHKKIIYYFWRNNFCAQRTILSHSSAQILISFDIFRMSFAMFLLMKPYIKNRKTSTLHM